MRIRRVFAGVHMGLGHPGLIEMCKESFKLDLTKLAKDDLVLFLNRKLDKAKVLGHAGWVMGYIRSPQGQRLMLEALQYLPQTFGAKGFDYDEAVRKTLADKFAVKARKKASPLKAAKAARQAGVA